MIKLFIMDVDGTLTDGKIYMGTSGELFKAFDAKDGYGIHELLPKHNIIPVIITGRTSEIVRLRAKELDISELYQGHKDKESVLFSLAEKYNCSLSEVAFIGDDVPDSRCMKIISESGGLTGCPADAVRQVKSVCSFISEYNGGNGAVRDFIEYIIRAEINKGEFI